MKVLLFNRNPHLWLGGDAIQVDQTWKHLRKNGVDSDFSFMVGSINEYDIIHAFHLNFRWSEIVMQEAIKLKKPLVISAIYFTQEYDLPRRTMKKYANYASKIICLSETEKMELCNDLDIDESKVVVIPNGIDKTVFKNKKVNRRDYVVNIGRTDPLKGVGNLALMCAEHGLKFVFIGEVKDDHYSRTIKKHLHKHYQNISPEEVAKVLNRAKVYVCPSMSERQSLGVLEAAACGVPIVDSIYNRGNDLLPSSIIVDPTDRDMMFKAVVRQWGKTNTDPVPSWDDITKRIITEVYEPVLESKTSS